MIDAASKAGDWIISKNRLEMVPPVVANYSHMSTQATNLTAQSAGDAGVRLEPCWDRADVVCSAGQ